jgi:arylsulfatase A-like enzyme
MAKTIARLLLLVLAAFGCGGESQVVPTSEVPRNVLFVMVDTLRADHMSTYGYKRRTTPFIDRFAEKAVVFERARAQASCTFPSVNSIMTSRYPELFMKQGPGQFGIPAEYPAIAEILDAHGYRTMAVSASLIVRATPSDYNPSGGFDRGFDTFVEGCAWRHGACLSSRVERHLDGLEEPYFLYIHYMEPHEPYQPPERFSRKFAGDYEGYDFIRKGDPNPIGTMLYAKGPKLDIGEPEIHHLIDLYDEEIRYFDTIFRRLLETLDERGLLDRTLIVLASDHGEEFLEHGQVKHCRGLWDTVTHVPLILRIPGLEEGRRIDAAVGNIDIVPTILDYLGIENDGFGFEGSSLRPLIEGRDTGRRFAFSDVGRYRGVDDGRFHLVFDASANRLALFDVTNDPLEQRDLFDPSHPAVTPLSGALNDWLEANRQRFRIDESVKAFRDKEEELRALGYLE